MLLVEKFSLLTTFWSNQLHLRKLNGVLAWRLLTRPHIVPFGKFHRIRGAPPETFPNFKYDAPEELGGNRKSFDSPIRK